MSHQRGLEARRILGRYAGAAYDSDRVADLSKPEDHDLVHVGSVVALGLLA
jgi:hypothetical protein